MKIRPLVLLLSSLTCVPFVAVAEEGSSISYNLGIASDYRYRGISQTETDPALQGGADYSASNGFYVGTWASTISWLKDEDGDDTSKVEIDVYAGKKGEFAEGFTYDFGVLTYIYPSHDQEVSPNTTEVYGSLGFGPAYIKYSHAVTDLFGFDDSDGSGYLDIGVNYEFVPTWTLNAHVGHQDVKNYDDASYTDYLLGVTKDFDVVIGSLAVVSTDIDDPVDEADTGVVLTVKKVF